MRKVLAQLGLALLIGVTGCADGGRFNWIWGYDEITWFAHQNKQDRSAWLRYAWNWVRTTDPNGYLEMPGSRMITNGRLKAPGDSAPRPWYHANNPSAAAPDGMGDEDTIRAIWAGANS